LSASAVVGLLDPNDDRESELISGLPPLPVEDVLLQEAEERFHRGVVGAGTDPAHRAVQAVLAQGANEGVRAELTASVGVHDCVVRSPQGAGVGDRVDRELGGHPFAHRVADDPGGAGVLDRAEVELAFTGGMFGDVGQPELVGPGGGELPFDEIVVDRRSRLTRQSPRARVHRPKTLLGAEPIDPLAARNDAELGEFVGDEPVTELGVVVMDVDRGVDQLRVAQSRSETGLARH
jgi:hypothetical protein